MTGCGARSPELLTVAPVGICKRLLFGARKEQSSPPTNAASKVA